jgi:hypothetical protein
VTQIALRIKNLAEYEELAQSKDTGMKILMKLVDKN